MSSDTRDPFVVYQEQHADDVAPPYCLDCGSDDVDPASGICGDCGAM